MKYLLLIFFLVSCASESKKEIKPETIPDSDPITLATAKQLAQNSYLSGCVYGAKLYKPRKRHFSHCLNQAKNFMKNNVDYILKQDGRRRPTR
jgi:hypothetical protein